MENTMKSEQLKFLEYAKKYNNFFSKEIMEYINSLIMLETSILKSDNISSENMEILMSIILFRNLVKFNLYQKTIKLFSDESKKLNLKCGVDTNNDIRINDSFDDSVWSDHMFIEMKKPYIKSENEPDYYEYFHLLDYERVYNRSSVEHKNIILYNSTIEKNKNDDIEKYKNDMQIHFAKLFEQANGISDDDYYDDITKINENEKNEHIQVKTYRNINVNVYKKTLY